MRCVAIATVTIRFLKGASNPVFDLEIDPILAIINDTLPITLTIQHKGEITEITPLDSTQFKNGVATPFIICNCLFNMGTTLSQPLLCQLGRR